MYLIDTSAWIAHFSRSDAFDLRTICSPDERVLCLPVYQEILQGIRDEAWFREMTSILQSARFVEVPMTMALFDEAVSLYRIARKQGRTIRASADCLVAAAAIRHDLTVVHRDRDYTAIASVSALRERTIA